MKKLNYLSRNGENITVSAVIYFPPGFAESQKYPAIVVTHPGGGVKEQTAGTYDANWPNRVSSRWFTMLPTRGRARASRARWRTLMFAPKTSAPPSTT
jgi:fermentation-respiration switch protein FrsA (DUF1100 family)